MSAPIRSQQARSVRIGIAVVAGTAAAYGAARFLMHRTSEARTARNRMSEWLATRLEKLSDALELTANVSDKVTKEIRQTARIAMKLAIKSRRTKPEVGDLLRIIADKRLLRMKQRLHRLLDLSDTLKANVLYDFYEELRRRIFGAIAPIEATESPLPTEVERT